MQQRWQGSWRFRGVQGLSMIELLVGLGILAAIGVAMMSGLATAFRSQDITREQLRAENLARAQLESIRNQPYLDTYAVSVPLPAGYSITINTQPFCTPQPCIPDNKIQQNTVTVFRGGKSLRTVSDLKTRR